MKYCRTFILYFPGFRYRINIRFSHGFLRAESPSSSRFKIKKIIITAAKKNPFFTPPGFGIAKSKGNAFYRVSNRDFPTSYIRNFTGRTAVNLFASLQTRRRSSYLPIILFFFHSSLPQIFVTEVSRYNERSFRAREKCHPFHRRRIINLI